MRSLPLPDPGAPPLTSASRLLLWQAGRQRGVLALSALAGTVSMLSAGLSPLLLGQAIDAGLSAGFVPDLFLWCGWMLVAAVLVVASGIFSHTWDIENWLRGAFSMAELVGDRASRVGHSVTATLPTGEVVATVANDAPRVGEMYAMAGRTFGGVMTYLLAAGYMLTQNLTLGLVLTLGIPVVAVVLALGVKPLQSRQRAQREASGRLTSLGADTVSGLRILRGIGGEDVFTERYARQSQEVRRRGVHVAVVQSVIDGLQVLLPGLLAVLVLWLGARSVLSGELTSGQLVTFYGYAAFLAWPVQMAMQMLQITTNAFVSARKILAVLQVRSATPQAVDPADAPPSGTPMTDAASGLVLAPGRIVGLVCADPDVSAAVATRFGRLDDAVETASVVTLGGVALTDLDKDELRRRVVVSEAAPHLFSGVLADAVDVRGRAHRDELLAAMLTADAGDVLDSVPGGLDGHLPEKGRSLSGGQRQRVALARALLTDAEVLVLVEPTSAVDAHSESRIAERVARARAGRTTLVVTASPLVLDHVDEVVLLSPDGRVVTSGTHHGLLTRADDGAAAYRDVVGRSMADEPDTEGTDLQGAAR